jgi:hypothetical protein
MPQGSSILRISMMHDWANDRVGDYWYSTGLVFIRFAIWVTRVPTNWTLAKILSKKA